MERLHDHITVDHIKVVATKGAREIDAMMDSLELAARERCAVKLIHNANAYWIDPGQIVGDIAEHPIEGANPSKE